MIYSRLHGVSGCIVMEAALVKYAVKIQLKLAAAGIICSLFSASVSSAFEVDGLVSGMSIKKATAALQMAAYSNIQTTEHSVMASGGSRFILLSFCKDRLVLVQQHLSPGFDNFIRLIDEKRKELGKPADSWGEPAEAHLPVNRNAISLLWTYGGDSVKVTFTELALNRQLDILYEVKNDCRRVPD
jgi:hypothetical protein